MTRPVAIGYVITGSALMAFAAATYFITMLFFTATPPVPWFVGIAAGLLPCGLVTYPMGVIIFAIGIYGLTRRQSRSCHSERSEESGGPL